MGITDRPTFDVLDPDFYRADPHEAFTWMRANEPVYRDEKNSMWVVSRHADVLDVERRAAVFSSRNAYRAIAGEGEENMIAHDDPTHLAQRRIVNRRFTPRAVRSQDDEFAALIDELIAAFVGDGRVEVVEALAAQLPSRLTCRMLGFDEDEWPLIKSWSERLMRTDSREASEERMLEFIGANMELYQRVADERDELSGCPVDLTSGTGLMAVWANDDAYDVERMFHEVGLFVAGGAETTRTVIAHGLRVFCDHPEQWEALAADSSLAPAAVEEMIRWVTPLNNMFRRATSDDVVGGQPIAAGDRLMLAYPSANRDEAVFEDPFTFDIARDPNPHLAFGHGTHFCLGANFARHELTILLQKLAAAVTDLRPIGEPDVEPNIFARAVRRFDLAFTPRSQRGLTPRG